MCQVVAIDDGSIRCQGDPVVSYFDDMGNLSDDSRLHIAEHFVKVCTTAIFEEHPECQHSTLLRVMNTNY